LENPETKPSIPTTKKGKMQKLIQLRKEVRSLSDIVNINYEDETSYSTGKHIVTFGIKGSYNEATKEQKTYGRKYIFESENKYYEFLAKFQEFMNNDQLFWDASPYILDRCKPSPYDKSMSDYRE